MMPDPGYAADVLTWAVIWGGTGLAARLWIANRDEPRTDHRDRAHSGKAVR